MTRDEMIAAARKMLVPCLWHGTTGGPNGPQPKGGAGFCAQCARRHDRLVISPVDLLRALGEEVK